ASTRWRRSRAMTRSRRSPRARGATRPTSGSGCAASRVSLWSRATAHRARLRMRSSRWHAHGNVYIVHEGDGRGVDATGTDGVLEVLAVDDDDVTIGILKD